jgi:4-aminobutyrate aminotransferase-like enzyme
VTRWLGLLAVLNTLEEEGLYTLKDQYPSIVEIRGAGLFVGLELGLEPGPPGDVI